jgi:hypothetical protein
MSYQGGYPPYQGQGYPAPPYGRDPDQRPGKVTAVAILAIVFGGLGALGGGFSLLLITALGGIEDSDLGLGMLWLFALWSFLGGAAEVVGGVFTLMRRNWARMLLTGVFAVGVLVNVYGLVVGYGLVTAVLAIALGGFVIAMLWMRDSSAWFEQDSLQLDFSKYPGYSQYPHLSPAQHPQQQYPGQQQYPNEYPGQQYPTQYPGQYPGQQQCPGQQYPPQYPGGQQ